MRQARHPLREYARDGPLVERGGDALGQRRIGAGEKAVVQ